MKLKIVHQNQDNRAAEEQVSTMTMKKEEEKMEVSPMADPVISVPAPEDRNFSSVEASPLSFFNPGLVSGKRKRKPRELIDEVSPIIRIRKRKSSSSGLKSKTGTSYGGEMFPSNKDGNAGGSSSPIQSKSPTVIRAEEVQSSLGNDHPVFLKPLVRSHVGSCFWMGLPVFFCKMHLPSKDTMVVLENEDGEEFPIKYIAHKTGLSAGWRKFVAGNKLLEGDVLIFQLIGSSRFKVYVIRANDLTEVDGALSLLILDSQTKQNESGYRAEGSVGAAQSNKKKRPKSLPLTAVQKKDYDEGQLTTHIGHSEEQSGNDSDEVASEVLEDTKFLGSSSNFKDAKTFDEFHITINGTCLDSELPEDTRRKYYHLCHSKNMLLHERLLSGLCTKLACGIITETVNIADLIRGCKLTTPRKDFEVWEKSLRSFELLGLNVGFLRSRLRKLLTLAFDSDGAFEIRRYLEAEKEYGRTEDEIQKLEARLVELKELSTKYDYNMEMLKSKAESYVRSFQEEVEAPW